MKTGDAILYYKSGIIGRLIGFFSKSKFSHVGIVLMLESIPFVIEADGFKNDVVIIDFQSSTKDKKYLIKELKKPLDDKKLKQDISQITNLEYDYKTLIRHIYKKRFKEDNSTVICSELGVVIYEAYHNLKNVIADGFTPEDFNSNPILTKLFKG